MKNLKESYKKDDIHKREYLRAAWFKFKTAGSFNTI